MSARFTRKVIVAISAVALTGGCTSTGSSSGTRWPWTKPKATAADEAKQRNADVLGAPPPPKHAKAGANKPSLSGRNDGLPSVTLRSPRIIDDREIDRAAR